ncbi:hypothetical protein PENSPDRAFT_312959 [Peniophora sp. CONT]|nr:hypothetical protein PENSPDRAFT_312959 [Peniophora sp. CONT]
MRNSSDMQEGSKHSPSVYSIPPEILGRVFEFLVEIDPPRSSALQNRHRSASAGSLRPESRASTRARRNTVFAPAPPDRLGWFRVTHVSHYFRSAALAYPALWDTIPFSLGENWARLALERSQTAGLVVRHAIYNGTRGSDVLTQTDFLADVLDRVRVVELSGAQETLGAVLARLRKPAAQLEVLSMQADRNPGPNEDWPFTIPRSLFQVDAPGIRELRLDGVFLSTLPPHIPSLKHLSICLRQSSQEYPRTRDVYGTLRVAPNLRTLVLKHCLPRGEIIGLEPVTLPSLESLELVDADSAISRFMEVATFPSTATLDVQCSMVSNSEEDESSRAQSLVVKCISRWSYPHSMVFASDGRGLEVSVSSTAAGKPDIYIFILPSGSPVWDYQRLVQVTSDAISSPSLQSIELRFPVAPSSRSSSWKELPELMLNALSRFDVMESVNVSRALGWAMCTALNSDPTDVLFPRLRELTLEVVDFFEPAYLDSPLESLAHSRKGVLEKLRLVGCEYLGRERLIAELRTLLEVDVLDAELPLVVVEP